MSDEVRTCPKCGYERCRLDSHNVWFCICGHEWSDDPDPRNALIARLRAENVALHKVVIDAMAALPQALFAEDFGEVDAATVINAVINILDSAPEPSDETLRLIEDTGGDDDN